jgi:hypothetical protein
MPSHSSLLFFFHGHEMSDAELDRRGDETKNGDVEYNSDDEFLELLQGPSVQV